jgi:hypothetical protein
MLIPEDSPLRRPPADFSRSQVLVLDGIRYAAEMAHIAYERLYVHVQGVSASRDEPRVRDTAIAMLDAWSIVDSAHRFRDMVANLPGLGNSPWRRLLNDRTDDIADLRNRAQHQLGEIAGLAANGGQLWGYLSWAEVRDGRYTGKWLMMTGGAVHVGDQWLFIGPAELPFQVPVGRLRLNAFGHQVYLGRTVSILVEAVRNLENEIQNGQVRPLGGAAERRGGDLVYEGRLEVLVANDQPAEPGR